MTSTPLIFYISPQWKQKFSLKHLHKSKSLDTWYNQSAFNLHDNLSLIDVNQIPNRIFSNIKHRYLTINLNKIDHTNQSIKIARDLNEILNDIQTYRNQLYDTHGSIHIQIYSFKSKRCCCNQKQSNEICKQISKFENELFQNDFVEYIYQIESIKLNEFLSNRILFNP